MLSTMQLIRPVAAILLVCSVSALLPAPAAAHFILVAPDAWMSQDALGLPEKLGPCGDEGGGIPTGKVTAFEAGQTEPRWYANGLYAG